MKTMIKIGMSFSIISLLLSGCGDTNVTTNTTEAQSYSISGDVKGCVTDASGASIAGAEVSIGNVSGVTAADGCYKLNITITTINSKDTAATNFAQQEVLVKHEKFEDTIKYFIPTENVIAGVIYDFKTYTLNTDPATPKDQGITDVAYSNNMLKDGVDGSSIPFKVNMSEYVELANNINDNLIIELKDADQNDSSMSVTGSVSFDSASNTLAISTSTAIPEGYYVTFRIPAEDIKDVNGLDVTSGTDATVAPFGVSLSDYWSFNVRVFTEGDLNAEAVTQYSQMGVDSGLDVTEVYTADLAALEAANASFKNLVKFDENTVSAKQISMFNAGGSLTTTRMKRLADAYITDPTVLTTVSIVADVVRIKFTPTNAESYLIKAYDDANNSINITSVLETVNANSTINLNNNLEVDNVLSATEDVEIAFKGLDANVKTTIAIVPMSAAGTSGTATTFIVEDNVAPTTSLQYSYSGSDDTSSDVTTSGGVVTSVLYGGSGETSNPEDITTPVNTVYTIGTPYLEMTNALLIDQNATDQNTGLNTLATPYTASDYATWTSNSIRSVGIGFTEAININGIATLTKTDGTDATALITATINTVDNLPVTSAATGLTEDIAIFTVSNIFTLVNDHNGSVIDLTDVATDLAGNPASSAKVILVDKVAPYIVSADINSSDMNNSTITFSENIVAGSVVIGGVTCTIDDGNISANIASLDGCPFAGNGITNIDFSLMPDTNGNNNGTHTFDANVTN